jgi:hypothetical protein
MIQEEGTRICTYMRSKVQSVWNRVKGPMAGRKYILGSGNGVRRQLETESGVPGRSESPYTDVVGQLLICGHESNTLCKSQPCQMK